MGWTDIFKSKSLKLKPDPQVRWFGKLPTYADYYSSKADALWSAEFNDWILKGYELYHKRNPALEKEDRRLPIGACVVRLPRTEMTVFASILDYGGDNRGRPFPMCFYVGMPSFQLPGPTSEQLATILRVLRDLTALRDRLGRFLNSPGRIEDYFGDRDVDMAGLSADAADDSWRKQGKTIALSDWFADARDGLKIQEAEVWARSTNTWGASIAQHESKTFEPTLRFPLSMRLNATAQIAGWFRWLETRMDLKTRSLSLTMTGEANNGLGYLAVIARALLNDDFLLLTPLADSLSYVDDLCKVEPPKNADSQGTEASAPALPANWTDFIEPPGGAA